MSSPKMAKSKKNRNKPKLNLTVREEQRNKLEQMASLENRSVSNLIEVMADERWKRLAGSRHVKAPPAKVPGGLVVRRLVRRREPGAN